MAAVAEVPESDLAGRLAAAGIAYRLWALAYPERYHLIFGTPIPGYVAPMEIVRPYAARSLSALVSILEALRHQNKLTDLRHFYVNPDKLAMFEDWKKIGVTADIQSFSLAVLIWARVHGLVSLEISNNLPAFGPSAEELYQVELDSLTKEFIKE
jgi:hypothetical protein